MHAKSGLHVFFNAYIPDGWVELPDWMEEGYAYRCQLHFLPKGSHNWYSRVFGLVPGENKNGSACGFPCGYKIPTIIGHLIKFFSQSRADQNGTFVRHTVGNID